MKTKSVQSYGNQINFLFTKSNIYYDENSEESLVLTPADVVENDFNFTFDTELNQIILEVFVNDECIELTLSNA